MSSPSLLALGSKSSFAQSWINMKSLQISPFECPDLKRWADVQTLDLEKLVFSCEMDPFVKLAITPIGRLRYAQVLSWSWVQKISHSTSKNQVYSVSTMNRHPTFFFRFCFLCLACTKCTIVDSAPKLYSPHYRWTKLLNRCGELSAAFSISCKV